MKVIDFTTPDAIFIDLAAGSKKQALQELSKRAQTLTGADSRAIFEVLLAREKLGSTGIGNGIAIPHGRLDGLRQMHGLFCRLSEPVAFDAIDEQPVDLFFVILAPEDADSEHVKLLAQTARHLRDKSLGAQFRQADQVQTIFALLTGTPAQNAA